MKTKVPNSYKRFWAKVCVGSSVECWPWMGALSSQGYGNVKYEGAYTHAHRIAYRLRYGEFPRGAWVLHRCDNPPCCNPDHLFLGNAQTNTDDAKSKGRLKFRDRHPMSKLGWPQVNAIRELHKLGWAGRDIGRAFGVSFALISLIVNHKVWQNEIHQS